MVLTIFRNDMLYVICEYHPIAIIRTSYATNTYCGTSNTVDCGT